MVFQQKVALEGKGAAAGESFAWAIENPDKVTAIYTENPVMMSLMSKQILLDNLEPLSKAKIPLLTISGSLDPWLADNTKVLEQRYKKLGGKNTVLIRQGEGHFLTPKEPEVIVSFITGNTK